MKLYIAGRYGRRLELLAYAVTLENAGHTVTSRWLRHGLHGSIPDDQLRLPGNREHAARFALEDWDDIWEANTLIAFTEPPAEPGMSTRGGMWVEFGLALSWQKRVVICGPSTNVFTALPEVEHCADIAAVLTALTEEAAHV